MRKMKKVVSLIAAAVMVFALAVPVNAAGAEIPAAKDNVITLTEDVVLTEGYVVNGGNITLDLNGHDISLADDATTSYAIKVINNGSLIIKDSVGEGTISATYPVRVGENINTVKGYTGKDTVTIKGGNLEGAWGVAVWKDGTLNVEGGNIHGTVSGITGNGDNTNINITVSGGTITGDGVGMYIPQTDKTTITGGTITGETAVYVKSGNLNITGGTFSATGDKVDYKYNPSGANATGEALVVEACDYPGGNPKVSISGGTFSSKNASAVGSYVGNTATADEKVTAFITGGTFSSDVTEYVADNYAIKAIEGGYKVSCAHKSCTLTGKVAETCTTAGYSGDIVCDNCKETVEAGMTIKATGHTYVNGACACGDKLEVKVETEVVDTITKEEVKVEEVKEVTVVEDENTVKAEISVKEETTIIATEVATADDVKETEVVKTGVITEETAKAVKEAVLAGDTVKAEIVVNEVKTELIPTSAQTNIEKAAATVGKNAEVVQYLDVSVVLKAASTGKELGTVDKLATPIKVTVAIPENLKADNVKYVVIRDHNGTVTKLPTTLNENGTITFETDMFSTYALAVADADATAPKTGDTGMMPAAWVAIIAVAGIAFVAARRRSVVR